MMLSATKSATMQTRSFVSSVLFTTERYESMTVKNLQTELKKRRLPSTGNKQALVHRLGASDHQLSTSSTQPAKKVSSEEGSNVNAGPEVPLTSSSTPAASAPGQPLTQADNTASKVENLGAFTLTIPQPTRRLQPKNIKIPVLATNWAATADAIDGKLNKDVPRLSTASGVSNISHNLYDLEQELGENVENSTSRLSAYLKQYWPDVQPVKYETITRPLSKDEKAGLVRAAAIIGGLFTLSYLS